MQNGNTRYEGHVSSHHVTSRETRSRAYHTICFYFKTFTSSINPCKFFVLCHQDLPFLKDLRKKLRSCGFEKPMPIQVGLASRSSTSK